jgi:hypothetical protein
MKHTLKKKLTALFCVIGFLAVTGFMFDTAIRGGNGTFTGNVTVAGSFAAGSFTNNLSAFASTTSAQLAGVLTDESGTGVFCMTVNCVMTTPNIGAATATSVTTGQLIQSAATVATWKDNTGGTRASIPSNGTSQGTLNNWNLAGGSSISGTAVGGTSGTGNVLFDTSPAINRETVNTGVSQGSGHKHQRFTGLCTTAALTNTTCTSVLTWTSAFADASYTVVCQGEGNTGNVAFLFQNSHVAASVTVVIGNGASPSAVSFNNVYCVADHD